MPKSPSHSTLDNRKAPWADETEEVAAREEAVRAQLTIWRQHLPDLFQKFAKIPDPRQPRKVRHKAVVLLFYALLAMVFQYPSRRDANRNATSPTLAAALREIFPDIDSIPHFDTVERFLETIPVSAWEDMLEEQIQRLLRQHKVQRFLELTGWVVAVDGTQKFARHQPWDPKALRQHQSNGETLYRVYILEAVLVSTDGLTLPLMSVFCENPADASEQTKQDCELKVFRRLAKRLKEWFPKRRWVLVMDGLYPSGPVFQLCQRNRWDYMIILKDDSLKTVWEDAEGLRKLDKEGNLRKSHRWGDRDQSFWWVNDLEYEFKADGKRRRLRVHLVVCDETWTDPKTGETRHSRWAWISRHPLSQDNVIARCNQAGRNRWKIESNILVQKQYGDHYEHAYSYDWTAMQAWHYCMKLAHLLNVLTLWTTEIGKYLLGWHGYAGAIAFLRNTWTGRWLQREFFASVRGETASP